MAEGPVAGLSEYPGGDFGSTDGRRGPLCFVSPRRLPASLRQINGMNRRPY